MSTTTLSCDHPDCTNSAELFALKDSVKGKYCCAHMLSSTFAKCELLGIAGFPFIATAEDIPLFEQRQEVTEAALLHLSKLEALCEAELSDCERDLAHERGKLAAVLDRCFAEVRQHLRQRHADLKAQLQALGLSFQRYLQCKEAELPCEALCHSVSVKPRFLRLMLRDVSVEVATAVANCWQLSPQSAVDAIQCLDTEGRERTIEALAAEAESLAAKGQPEYALEATQYALQLGLQQPMRRVEDSVQRQQVENLIRLEALFHLAADTDAIRNTARQLFTQGRAEQSAGNYTESLVLLQGAWDLFHKYRIAEDIAEVGSVLGEVLCVNLSKFAQAEEVLSATYELEGSQHHLSERAVWLSIQIAEVYYCNERFADTESLCLEILQAFCDPPFSALNCWSALYYLALAYSQLRKVQSIPSVVDQWSDRAMTEEDERAKIMRLSVLARRAWAVSDVVAAEDLHLEVGSLVESAFPNSVTAARNLHLLGFLYSDMTRLADCERVRLQVHSLCAAHFPQSVLAADNQLELALLCHRCNRHSDAERFYLSACSTLAGRKSVHAAVAMNNLGTLYEETNRKEEAEKLYQDAKAIFTACAPVSDYAANNVYNLALLYEAAGKNSAAATAAEEALGIYTKIKDKSGVENAEAVLRRLKEKSQTNWISRFLP